MLIPDSGFQKVAEEREEGQARWGHHLCPSPRVHLWRRSVGVAGAEAMEAKERRGRKDAGGPREASGADADAARSCCPQAQLATSR